MRVLVDSDALVLSPTFVDTDGETATDADDLPSVAVSRSDGSALPAPVVADVDPGDGSYTAELLGSSHTDALDVLSLVWSGEVAGRAQVYAQAVEIVGEFYCSLFELRSNPDLSNPAKFPSLALRAARDEFESLAERYCEVAFVPRFAREELRGDGRNRITLRHHRPRVLRSISVGGEVRSVDDFAFDGCVLDWSGGTFTAPISGATNVVVEYEHGYDHVPEALAQACRVFVETRLLGDRGGIPRLAISVDSEFGNMRLATPGDRRPTGIPSVDAALNEYAERVPGVA